MSDQVKRVIEGFLDSEGFHQTNGASFSDWLKTHDAKVRADAKVEALREAADELAGESPFHSATDTEAHWQIGGKWAERLRTRAEELATS